MFRDLLLLGASPNVGPVMGLQLLYFALRLHLFGTPTQSDLHTVLFASVFALIRGAFFMADSRARESFWGASNTVGANLPLVQPLARYNNMLTHRRPIHDSVGITFL